MKKKWIGINLLLLVGVGLAAWKLDNSVHQYRAQNDLSTIKPAEARELESILPAPPVFQTSNPMTFAEIVNKNVFSETRTKGETPAADSPNGTMPATQKPTLVGVVITDTQRVASLLAPASGRNRNASAVQLKRVNESYEGYTVTAIEPDHIVLDNGSQKQIISLNDTSQPAQRRQTASVSTRVIPIGGGTATAASATAPIVLSSGLSQVQQLLQNRLMRQIPNASTAGAPGQAGTGGTFISPVLPNINSSQSGTIQTQQPAVIIQSSQPAGTSNAGTQGGSRIIRSPFGDIIRNPPGQ
jgi:hypothetical protein